MKKLLILLPALVVVLAAGVAFSKPEPAEKETSRNIEKRILEAFPHGGMQLGVVLSTDNPDKSGVLIDRVLPDSPADRAGLQRGDVIISLDGEKVSSARDIRDFIKDLDDARDVKVGIERDGKPMTVTVTPEKREGLHLGFGSRMYLGLNLQELDADLASYFQATPGSGVLVTRVEPDSPAEKAGIRSGDVITHMNGQKINEASDIMSKMENVEEGDTVELTVLRHGSEKKLIAKPEKREGGMHHFENMDRGLGMQMPDFMQRPEFQENMEQLHRDMEKFRDEMQINKDQMRQLKDQIQNDVRREMEKLKQELKDRKDET